MLRKPFRSTSDPDFYYLTDSARKAYLCITDAIRQRISYVVLSGDPGTGKTTLLNCLMADDTLPVHWIFINHASLSWEEILLAIGRALKIPGLPSDFEGDSGDDAENLAKKITVCLKQFADQGVWPVLILDEAQRLTSTTLLSLFEWHSGLNIQGAGLTVILSGQNKFTRTLIDSNLSRFTADATVHCRLDKLTPSECRKMIACRLETAGYSGPTLFGKKTLKEIFRLSGGIPRALNSICDFGLFMAATHARRKVSCEDIRRISQYMQRKKGDPYEENISFQVALPPSGPRSISPSTWRLFDFLQSVPGRLWKYVSARWPSSCHWPPPIFDRLKNPSARWRPLFSPWGYGIVGLLIVLGGGSVLLRAPTTIALIQTLAVDSQSAGRAPIHKFKIGTGKMPTAVEPARLSLPAKNDTGSTLQITEAKNLKPEAAENTDPVGLSAALAHVDTTKPEPNAEKVETIETVIRIRETIAEKRQPATHVVPVLKKRLAIAEISPVRPDLVPPVKKRFAPSASPSSPEQTLIAVKHSQPDASPISSQPVLAQSVPAHFKKPDPVSQVLLTAIRHGDVNSVREILSNGTDPNTVFSKNKTALTVAVDHGRLEIVKVLLDQGATINQPTPSGETALMKSAWTGHAVITDLLLNRGARVNSQNREGWTPLFYGSVMGRNSIVKTLLDRGARLGLADRDGRAPLMAAAWNGHAKVVRYLLAQGAQPNNKDRDGWTPLMFAAFEGHTDVAHALISHGANLLLKNNSGQNSAVLATNRGHTELYAIISTFAQQ